MQQLARLVSHPFLTSVLAARIFAPDPYPLHVAFLALMAGLLFKRKVHAKLGLAGALR